MLKLDMKINDEVTRELKKLLKLTLAALKLTALGTAVTSAVTALTNSLSAGFAMTAAGATTYAAAKNIPKEYDKTKHVSPLAKTTTVAMRNENVFIVKEIVIDTPAPLQGEAKHKQHVFVSKDAIVVRKPLKAGDVETEDEA
jgi:hypothetical protein